MVIIIVIIHICWLSYIIIWIWKTYLHAGFEEVKKPCCKIGLTGGGVFCKKKTSKICPNTSSYLFWDGAHPTERAFETLNKKLVKKYLRYIWLITIFVTLLISPKGKLLQRIICRHERFLRLIMQTTFKPLFCIKREECSSPSQSCLSKICTRLCKKKDLQYIFIKYLKSAWNNSKC